MFCYPHLFLPSKLTRISYYNSNGRSKGYTVRNGRRQREIADSPGSRERMFQTKADVFRNARSDNNCPQKSKLQTISINSLSPS